MNLVLAYLVQLFAIIWTKRQFYLFTVTYLVFQPKNWQIFSHFQYETTDKHLSPDGQYVPRILFVGKSLPSNLLPVDVALTLSMPVDVKSWWQALSTSQQQRLVAGSNIHHYTWLAHHRVVKLYFQYVQYLETWFFFLAHICTIKSSFASDWISDLNLMLLKYVS